MNCADIGMIQCRRRLRFPLKTCQRRQVFGDIVRKELQCYKTMEACVLSLVHDTHPTTTEFLQDAVVRDGLADERLGLRHLPVILGRGLEGCQKLKVKLCHVDFSEK